MTPIMTERLSKHVFFNEVGKKPFLSTGSRQNMAVVFLALLRCLSFPNGISQITGGKVM